jgi:transposase
MDQISRIGMDRSTVIAIEACGASHHLARLLQSFGHTVKLIAPQLAKPYESRPDKATMERRRGPSR